MNHAITVHDLLKVGGYAGGGVLSIGGFALAALCVISNYSQIIPSENSGAIAPFVFGCIGVAMIVGAFFVP